MPGWQLIVAGDLKTPHKLYKKVPNTIYLSPEYQERSYPKLSKLIGWNCIPRRNFAILEAYNRGADIIATVDDDNIPLDNWGKDLLLGREITVNCYKTSLPVFDPIGATNYPKLWHRGFPLPLIPQRRYDKVRKIKITPQIQADFWNGDPDIDAICRMEHAPKCKFNNKYFPIAGNKPSPFNSQNTFLERKVVKDYFLFPHIGRFDDIWASYYAQARGHRVVYCRPSVFQKRADNMPSRYSVIEDMRREFFGYENTFNLVQDLTKNPDLIKGHLPSRSWEAFKEYRKCFR